MAQEEVKTRIDAGGLRYHAKAPGSPFAPAGSFGAGTMSCFLCGRHRPRGMLMMRKLVGRSQTVCSPSCKALAEATA